MGDTVEYKESMLFTSRERRTRANAQRKTGPLAVFWYSGLSAPGAERPVYEETDRDQQNPKAENQHERRGEFGRVPGECAGDREREHDPYAEPVASGEAADQRGLRNRAKGA